MQFNKIYDLYQKFEERNIIFSFSGIITSNFLNAVLDIMESKVEYLEESPRIKKKVLKILVECVQNVYYHAQNQFTSLEDEETRKRLNNALVMVIKEEEGFLIETGNYIENKSVSNLKDRIDRINKLDDIELREYYREVLANGTFSDRGTAGLGMIDIARKSGNKLSYSFIPVDEMLSFFTLSVKIN
jgi:hypothetical protein